MENTAPRLTLPIWRPKKGVPPFMDPQKSFVRRVLDLVFKQRPPCSGQRGLSPIWSNRPGSRSHQLPAWTHDSEPKKRLLWAAVYPQPRLSPSALSLPRPRLSLLSECLVLRTCDVSATSGYLQGLAWFTCSGLPPSHPPPPSPLELQGWRQGPCLFPPHPIRKHTTWVLAKRCERGTLSSQAFLPETIPVAALVLGRRAREAPEAAPPHVFAVSVRGTYRYDKCT